ncbi:glycosyltransferase family 2 protein [Paenibacillus sp. UMB4589-SE434]|uniref:glycosyltransferase family 2 protein n=1 Tax=Paenibacillus sp. UMB4589-SE434 TaxID=3046314 RepID=UPI002549C418|nr:glycosyltransferase family 2 protein [Paenibacillus sp. UMB4589-SE434]MDK8183209.1 glycosyltransferase family 2 protein [Paenibacillus sp. UMB4589-SE434]
MVQSEMSFYNSSQSSSYKQQPILYIVVPCYNEEEVFTLTVEHLTEVMTSMVQEQLVSRESRLMFVDDGSRDATWLQIAAARRENPWVTGLKLARNAGHQKALLAGLMYAKEFADCVVSMDADLQDDTGVVRDFVLRYREGYDVVYGVRRSRETDTWFKRWSAEKFYKLMQRMGVNTVYNHADYRLMSKRALEHLAEYKEVNVFLRGIVPLIGFRTTVVEYDRHERAAGESKYPLKKMLSFAWEGITSFSVKPMRIVTMIGFLSLGASLLAAIYALMSKIMGMTVSGWTSLMVSVWFIGSIQLLALGVIGEYIGKIYNEVKHRPLYVIDEVLHEQPSAAAAPWKEAGWKE